MPEKVVGLYLLIADDGQTGQGANYSYQSDTKWVPKLPDYMDGVNVLWLAFVNPSLMPALPPAMQHIAQHRPNPNQKVIASIGGEAYSADAEKWPWHFLDSDDAAEAMAAEVVKWKTMYGIDGIDLDIEGHQKAQTTLTFARKLKQLDPDFIVTQPVFGYPAVEEEDYMVNQNFGEGNKSAVDKIGIMVYESTQSLQYVKNYVHGKDQWSGFPIHVDVPSQAVMLGAGGQASAGTIEALAKATHDQNLGGVMVWFASVIDTATGKVANSYGSMDSSVQSDATKATWKKALDIMNGKGYSSELIV